MWKLEARPEPSAFWRIASPLLALVLTVILGVLLFLVLGKDPVKGLQVFFWEPIRSAYALGELVEPMLRPLRRVVPQVGGVDVSPLALLVLLQVLEIVLHHLSA